MLTIVISYWLLGGIISAVLLLPILMLFFVSTSVNDWRCDIGHSCEIFFAKMMIKKIMKNYSTLKVVISYLLLGGSLGVLSLILPIISYLFIFSFDNNLSFVQSVLFVLNQIKTSSLFLHDFMIIILALIGFGSFVPMFLSGIAIRYLVGYVANKTDYLKIFLIGVFVPTIYLLLFNGDTMLRFFEQDNLFDNFINRLWVMSFVYFILVHGIICAYLARFITTKI